jgi:hypothetical protein
MIGEQGMSRLGYIRVIRAVRYDIRFEVVGDTVYCGRDTNIF